jgi:hypothetical protein
VQREKFLERSDLSLISYLLSPISTPITITITGFHYYSFPLTVDCKPWVKNLVAGRANEKPPHGTISFLEHIMEAVLVTALGTDFKFFTSVHLMYLVIHLTDLQENQ